MSSRFGILSAPLSGLNVITRKHVNDSRGSFERMFCIDELQHLLNGRGLVQINHSLTRWKGSVRGMHFQHAPSTEMKFVSCLRGEIFDVAVDLRPSSATFLEWHAEVLSADSYTTLVIPEGFAHGFQALTDNCELLYLHTNSYDPAAEGGLNPQDPRLAIDWPLPISEISARDAAQPMIAADFKGLML